MLLGDSVYATVTASNVYGESEPSVQGNGATVLQVPSAPISLTIDKAVVTKSVVGFNW